MDRVLQAVRSGEWLTRERIRMVAVAVLIASAAGFLYLVVTATGGVDRQGRPIGTDFSNVYAAGTYVLEGNPVAPFDSVQQFARERSIFGAATQFYGWHYPPYFLFVAAALAWMPYGLALFVWQAITLGLYLLAIRAILKAFAPQGGAAASADPLWLLLALAFPAVLINVGHGHNGFLTAALLGGGLVILDRRPLIAGILFGLMAYKPQFGLMIPIALAAGGYWRSFMAAAATTVLLTVVTTLVFGVQVWHAFFVGAEFTRTVVLEQGDTGWHKIQSVFSWARMWGAPVPLAYAIQGTATLVFAMATAWLWHGKAPYPLAQDSEHLLLGTHVGGAGSAGVYDPGHRDAGVRHGDGLVVARQGALPAQGRKPLPRRHPRHALHPGLRHDGAGAGHRLPCRRRHGARFRPVGKNRAGRALAGAAGRPDVPASNPDPARRAGDADDVCFDPAP